MGIFSGIIQHIMTAILPVEREVVEKIEAVKQVAVEVAASVEQHIEDKVEQAAVLADDIANVVLGSGPAKKLTEAVLDARAQRRINDPEDGEDLTNWRNSVVDFLKLVDRDPSLTNRRQLAAEFGFQGKFNGTAEQNIWLSGEIKKRLL